MITMATLTVQEIDHNVASDFDALDQAADVAGDKFANDGQVMFRVKNASGASINVTFNYKPSGITVDNQTVTAYTIAVGAGVTRHFGGFQVGYYNDPADGLLSVSYSAVASVTVLAYKSKP